MIILLNTITVCWKEAESTGGLVFMYVCCTTLYLGPVALLESNIKFNFRVHEGTLCVCVFLYFFEVHIFSAIKLFKIPEAAIINLCLPKESVDCEMEKFVD